MTLRLQHIKSKRHASLLSWLLAFVIMAFVTDVVLDSIGLISQDSLTTVELCDSKDVETNELADAEDKVEIKQHAFSILMLEHQNKAMNWSSSSYFSELHSEILTPPPEFMA